MTQSFLSDFGPKTGLTRVLSFEIKRMLQRVSGYINGCLVFPFCLYAISQLDVGAVFGGFSFCLYL